YTGRGPFEAAGVGIDLKPGDIAFRGNFASVDEDMKLTDRRAGRIREGTEELAGALDELKLGRIKATVRAGTEHRVAVVLRGRGDRGRRVDPRDVPNDRDGRNRCAGGDRGPGHGHDREGGRRARGLTDARSRGPPCEGAGLVWARRERVGEDPRDRADGRDDG